MTCVPSRLYGWNQSTATTTSSGDGGGWCDYSSDRLQHDRLRPTSGLQPAVRSGPSSGLQLGAVRLRSRLDSGQSRFSTQCTLCWVVCHHYILLNVWRVGNTNRQHCAWGLMHTNVISYMYTSREMFNLEHHRITPWQTIWKFDIYVFFSPHGIQNHVDYLKLFLTYSRRHLLANFKDEVTLESNPSSPACEVEAIAMCQRNNNSILNWILLYSVGTGNSRSTWKIHQFIHILWKSYATSSSKLSKAFLQKNSFSGSLNR